MLRAALRRVLADADHPAQLVLGFGRSAWEHLAPGRVPGALTDFVELGSETRVAPATQRDLWVWIQTERADQGLDVGIRVQASLRAFALLESDRAAFRRPENRGLEGFIDGTENPAGDAALAAAQIPEGQPGAGGSFALTQQWEHDLSAFQSLSVSEQEEVIGRTRAESQELEGARALPTSHVSLSLIHI